MSKSDTLLSLCEDDPYTARVDDVCNQLLDHWRKITPCNYWHLAYDSKRDDGFLIILGSSSGTYKAVVFWEYKESVAWLEISMVYVTRTPGKRVDPFITDYVVASPRVLGASVSSIRVRVGALLSAFNKYVEANGKPSVIEWVESPTPSPWY